jgi:hypothetical protein
MVFVPKAMAAMACAPPTRYTSVAPAARAAYNTLEFTSPFSRQGVQTTISGQPATLARRMVIRQVDTKGLSLPERKSPPVETVELLADASSLPVSGRPVSTQ